MRQVVLRAPETDRKLVEIPSELGDLTDYAVAHGSAIQASSTTAENATAHTLSLANFTELEGMSDSGSGSFLIAVAGLYIMVASVVWDWQTPGAIARQIRFMVNGRSAANLFLNSTVGDLQTDQFTYIYRLAVGDTVTVGVTNFNGGNSTTALASLQLARVAP
jgi:hypothetical protein